jgi:hypothetical protein
MDTKRKNESKNAKMQSAISYKEVDFYRDKFAEWLTEKAGKEARSAFFALWAIEIFSRFDVSAFDEEVARARQTLQKLLKSIHVPED